MMQRRSYLHAITRRRLRRVLAPPHGGRTSPCLLYVAVVLALLFAILEIDLHHRELESLGFVGSDDAVPSSLMGP